MIIRLREALDAPVVSGPGALNRKTPSTDFSGWAISVVVSEDQWPIGRELTGGAGSSM